MRIGDIFEHPLFLLLIRVLTGGLFVLFGISKALAPHEEFFNIIQQYHILPNTAIALFGTLLIYSEIIFGLLLIVGLFTRPAAWVVTVLLGLFLLALGQVLVRGIPLADCGCSAGWNILGENPLSVFLRDIVLFVGMVWLLTRQKIGLTLDRLVERL